MEAIGEWSERVYWYSFFAMVFSGVAVVCSLVTLYSLRRRIHALREHLAQALDESRSGGPS